jgi:1,4-dihydroxy-2-naphthoate polyprenyltransferase
VRKGSLAAWSAASRPRSLLLAVGPVLAGAALGHQRGGAFDAGVALAALAAALLMQLVTNLQNDVGYTVRGAEHTGTRTGLPRATAQGWLSVAQVRGAIVLVALLGTGFGIALTLHRGWPVLAIGAVSLLAALAYMGGPRPIAYTPFGELTVFVFFGPVAVMGSDWVLTGQVGAASVAASVALGCLAAAALAVNNHRDAAHDRQVGRRTLAVCLGAAASTRLLGALLLLPFLLLPLTAWLAGSALLLLPALLAPSAWRLHRDLRRSAPGRVFNALLFRSFTLSMRYALLLAAAAVADAPLR